MAARSRFAPHFAVCHTVETNSEAMQIGLGLFDAPFAHGIIPNAVEIINCPSEQYPIAHSAASAISKSARLDAR